MRLIVLVVISGVTPSSTPPAVPTNLCGRKIRAVGEHRASEISRKCLGGGAFRSLHECLWVDLAQDISRQCIRNIQGTNQCWWKAVIHFF
jgi:hypothetical protein